jgi:hypothetical protein
LPHTPYIIQLPLIRGIVDVFALDPAPELLTLYAENVYVAEVYDNAGNKVT